MNRALYTNSKALNQQDSYVPQNSQIGSPIGYKSIEIGFNKIGRLSTSRQKEAQLKENLNWSINGSEKKNQGSQQQPMSNRDSATATFQEERKSQYLSQTISPRAPETERRYSRHYRHHSASLNQRSYSSKPDYKNHNFIFNDLISPNKRKDDAFLKPNEASFKQLFNSYLVNQNKMATRSNSKNRKNQSTIDFSYEGVGQSQKQKIINLDSFNLDDVQIQGHESNDKTKQYMHLSKFLTKKQPQSQVRNSQQQHHRQCIDEQPIAPCYDGHYRQHIEQENNMSTILSYSFHDRRPSEGYNRQQNEIRNSYKYDINKNVYVALTGDRLNKDGLIPKRIVDACFQDILTGDPFEQTHQFKQKHRQSNHNLAQEQANSRSLASKVPLEKRRPSIVPQSKFKDLELIKQQAASSWFRGQNAEYKHDTNMEQKRYYWKMQEQDALNAREQATIRQQLREQQPLEMKQKMMQTGDVFGKRHVYIKLTEQSLTKSLPITSHPSSPYFSDKNEVMMEKIKSISNMSGCCATTNCATPTSKRNPRSKRMSFGDISKDQIKVMIAESDKSKGKMGKQMVSTNSNTRLTGKRYSMVNTSSTKTANTMKQI